MESALLIGSIAPSSSLPIFSLSRLLSMVRICSSSTTESRESPHWVPLTSIWLEKLRFFLLAGDGGCYDRRAVTVPHVILYYEYRPQASLFGTDYRAEIRIVNIASFDSHADSRSAFDLLGCILSLLFPQKTKLNHGDDKKLLFIIGLPLCFTKASHSFRHNSLGDSTAYAARPFRPGFWGPFSLYCPPSVFDRHTASFSTNQT